VVEQAAGRLPGLRVLRLPTQRGAYVARNVGLAAARGEFVIFQDADDFAHPERLAEQIKPMLRDPDLHATTSRCIRLSDDGFFGDIRLWPLTRWTPISLALRRSPVLDRVGGFEEVRYGADSEYVARLRTVLGQRHHRLIPRPLAVFAQRSGSLTTSGATGFDRHGHSRDRMAYQEAWAERHLACLLGGPGLYRPLPNRELALITASA
jgi:glycosyltransferase involved in cell wall biosynthesis